MPKTDPKIDSKIDSKNTMKEVLQADHTMSRGAMLEVLENTRLLADSVKAEMGPGNYALLEEYQMLTKTILDTVKTLSELNSNNPKTIKEINQMQDEKVKINLDELMG